MCDVVEYEISLEFIMQFFFCKERELESNPLTDYVDLIWLRNQNFPSRYLTLFDKIFRITLFKIKGN